MIGALALALPLAACGRKGALDPPPGGYVLEQGDGQDADHPRRARRRRRRTSSRNTTTTAGRSLRRGPKKKLPGDWLID